MYLIIEDAGPKAADIRKAVSAAGVPDQLVTTVPDVVLAKDQLKRGVTCLVLDLQIPNRHGDRTSEAGGVTLLRWISRHLKSKPPHIIAVTAYDVAGETSNLLNTLGIPVVPYAPSSADWSDFLTGYVRRIHAQTATSQPSIDAVVLTAVDVEMYQVRRVFGADGAAERHAGTQWFRSNVFGKQIVVAQASQMGMPATATLVAKAISTWRPKVICCSGICAGYSDKVALGDIVVPDPCWDYGSGKLENSVLKPDPRPIPLQEVVRTTAKGIHRDQIRSWTDEFGDSSRERTNPQLSLGPACSGAAVVADKDLVTDIRNQSRKIVGIDMENYALYYGASNSGRERAPLFFSAKAVVDYADKDKDDNFQQFGAYIAARYTKWLIGELLES